jgi:hypothetical protein
MQARLRSQMHAGLLHCGGMDAVSTELIDKFVALADELPDEQRQQLLKLVSGWRTDVRRAPRESYTELLNFTSSNGTHYGHARDISATGVFVATPAAFQVGDSVNLVLTFISAPNPVRLSGTVVRKTDEGVGIQFDRVSRSQLTELNSIVAKHALILHRK